MVVLLVFCQLGHAPLDADLSRTARWTRVKCPRLVGGEGRLEAGASGAATATGEEGNPGSLPRRRRLRPLRRGAFSPTVEGRDGRAEKRRYPACPAGAWSLARVQGWGWGWTVRLGGACPRAPAASRAPEPAAHLHGEPERPMGARDRACREPGWARRPWRRWRAGRDGTGSVRRRRRRRWRQRQWPAR